MLVFADGVADRYVRGRNALASPYRYELEIDPAVWFLEDEGYRARRLPLAPGDQAGAVAHRPRSSPGSGPAGRS